MNQVNFVSEQIGAYHMLVRDCLNVVENRGNAYVAIHKDDECECVILVSLIHDQSLLSIIIADMVLFAEENSNAMYEIANTLSAVAPMGWNLLHLSGDQSAKLYRQCLCWNDRLNRATLIDILCRCIDKYKSSSGQGQCLGNTQ